MLFQENKIAVLASVLRSSLQDIEDRGHNVKKKQRIMKRVVWNRWGEINISKSLSTQTNHTCTLHSALERRQVLQVAERECSAQGYWVQCFCRLYAKQEASSFKSALHLVKKKYVCRPQKNVVDIYTLGFASMVPQNLRNRSCRDNN